MVFGETRELCDLHRDFMLQIMEKIATPLEAIVAKIESNRSDIAATTKRLQSEYKASNESVRRAQQRYFDAAAAKAEVYTHRVFSMTPVKADCDIYNLTIRP